MAVHDIIPRQFTADDVRDTLNAGGGSVGNNWVDYFGEKANIDMWSKNKPFRLNLNGEATSTNKYDANYGIDLASVGNSSLLELFKKAIANSSWKYLFPRGGSYNEPFRFDDFIGYNRNSKPRFDYSEIPSTIKTPYATAMIIFNFKANTNVDIPINDFKYFHKYDGVNSFHYAVAYRPAGSSDISYSNGPDITRTDDITIQVVFPKVGSYECLLIATTLKEDNSQIYTDSVFMHNGYFKIDVIAQISIAAVAINSGFTNARMDSTDLYNISNISLTIKSKTGEVVQPVYYRIDLLVYIYNYSNEEYASMYISSTNLDKFGYSGVSASNETITVFAGKYFRFSDYEINGSEVHHCKIVPQLIKVSGDGQSKMEFTDNYYYIVNR